MGAAPRLALVSMVLPDALPLADFDGIIDGLTALAARYRLHVAGGNLSRSPGPLMIDITVVGTLKRRQALRRAGARPGDEIYVSGTIGAAAAGLALLRRKHDSFDHGCVERYLRPDPRLRLGVWLGRNRAASACVDLSDGLADAVHRLAAAGGVGILVDAAALPIDAAARTVLGSDGADATMAAITGGDDYELLIAIRPAMRRYLKEAARQGGVPLTRIGACTAECGVRMRVAGADAPLPDGYTHFGRIGTEPSGR
jgi:thiamine-monophosphate kinase